MEVDLHHAEEIGEALPALFDVVHADARSWIGLVGLIVSFDLIGSRFVQERVTRRFLLNEPPDLLLVFLDGVTFNRSDLPGSLVVQLGLLKIDNFGVAQVELADVARHVEVD